MIKYLKSYRKASVILGMLICITQLTALSLSGINNENMVLNGEFDNELNNWIVEDFSDNSAMTVTIDSTSQLSGKNSAKIVITQSSGTDWHLQLRQFFDAVEGNMYDVTFQVKASKHVSMMCMLQKVTSPYTAIGYSRFDITTTPFTYTYSGTGTGNFETAVAFFFGDIDVGTTIWIDAIQMTEVVGNERNFEVVVDLANELGPAKQCGSGTLFGLNGTQPDDEWVLPIKLKTYRAQEMNWSIFQSGLYERLESIGVSHIQVLMLGKNVPKGQNPYTWKNEENKPGLNGNWDTWINNLKDMVQDINKDEFKNIEYEIWNEPDFEYFWPWTREHFFETWRVGSNAIREEDTSSIIMGPSLSNYMGFDFEWLTSFLSYCKNNNCLPDILNWHELGDSNGDKIPIHVSIMRQWMADNGIAINRISIGEIIPNNRNFVPGTVVSYMANIERADIESAAHSCWDEYDPDFICNCWNNSLNGLLTQDLQNARSCWWAFKGYADITGKLVHVTAEPIISVDAVAGFDDSQETIKILLGNHDINASSNVLLNLKNLDNIDFLANKEKLYVKAELITNTEMEPLEEPALILDEEVAIQDNQLTISLKLDKGEACVLRFNTSFTNIPFAPGNVNAVPGLHELFQNFPNPFNQVTQIKYTLKSTNHVKLIVYDMLSHEVTVLVDEIQHSGPYSVEFYASELTNGIYFYKLEAGSQVLIKKMVLLK